MLLVGSWRISQLISQKSQKSYRLMQIDMELSDLKTYGENIADGQLSPYDMMNCPSSMFSRQMQYLNASSQYAQMIAQTQMTQLASNPMYQQMMAQSQNAQLQMDYQKYMYQSFYRQAQQQFCKMESRMLHEKEKAIEQEKQALEEDIAMIEAELKSTREAVKNDAQNFAPQYA